ncbi:MAG: lysophospholipid acyltransferase family protein [Rubripirellula sp.]
MTSRDLDKSDLAAVSPFLYRGFRDYSRRLLRKRFRALRVAQESFPHVADGEPLLIYTNHPSWWDPLVAVTLNESLFNTRQFRAPIDAEALKKYAILGRLGFFPIERESSQGTRGFLTAMQTLLSQPTAIYITPQGKFVDVRDQQPFEPGLAHVVSRMKIGTVLPMAIEYTYWDESTPEILVQFGSPIDVTVETERSKEDWNRFLEATLASTQASLAAKGISRSADGFNTIVGGRVGEGGLYDFARRVKSMVSGRKFDPSHEAASAPAQEET